MPKTQRRVFAQRDTHLLINSIRGVRHFVVVPWEACTRCWIGDPYAGPMVIWPDMAPPKPEKDARPQRPKRRPPPDRRKKARRK